jgi:hypothetical protein
MEKGQGRGAVREFSVRHGKCTRPDPSLHVQRERERERERENKIYKKGQEKNGRNKTKKNQKGKWSSGTRGSDLLELYDRGPSGTEQRAFSLARGLANNIVSESEAHCQLCGHLHSYGKSLSPNLLVRPGERWLRRT